MGVEEQKEEIEVLDSIYDGDPKFRRLSETVFQYQCGEDGDFKSFIVQITWGPDYPEQPPDVSLEVFFNQHLTQAVKDAIKEEALRIANENLDMAMTYTIFEGVKDAASTLTEAQPEAGVARIEDGMKSMNLDADKASGKEKKEVLTKAQKRKQFDRLGNKGELPRGWNWMDIVKHLGQTGGGKA